MTFLKSLLSVEETFLPMRNKKQIIETIFSVDNSLFCLNRRELLSKMRLIEFKETQRYDVSGFCYIEFKGKIENSFIHLFFSHNVQNTNDKSYYLINKTFSKAFAHLHLEHRDNDLPSIIRYDFDLSMVRKSSKYFIDGDLKRLNKSDPVVVNVSSDASHYSYNVPEEQEKDELYLQSINIIEGIVTSVYFKLNSFIVSLPELTLVFPFINKFEFDDFLHLNETLTHEEKKLIEMIII